MAKITSFGSSNKENKINIRYYKEKSIEEFIKDRKYGNKIIHVICREDVIEYLNLDQVKLEELVKDYILDHKIILTSESDLNEIYPDNSNIVLVGLSSVPERTNYENRLRIVELDCEDVLKEIVTQVAIIAWGEPSYNSGIDDNYVGDVYTLYGGYREGRNYYNPDRDPDITDNGVELHTLVNFTDGEHTKGLVKGKLVRHDLIYRGELSVNEITVPPKTCVDALIDYLLMGNSNDIEKIRIEFENEYDIDMTLTDFFINLRVSLLSVLKSTCGSDYEMFNKLSKMVSDKKSFNNSFRKVTHCSHFKEVKGDNTYYKVLNSKDFFQFR